MNGLNRSSGVQRWKSALPFRPISGPLKWSETLVVAGTEPTHTAPPPEPEPEAMPEPEAAPDYDDDAPAEDPR